MAGRTIEERARHVVERLEGDADVWIATASRDGRPHLVPLSLYWDGTRIVVTNPKSSVTTANVVSTGIARFALNSSEDVVIIDAIVTVVDIADAADGLPESYAERTGWDPRDQEGDWVFLVARPDRILAWNGPEEIEGRTVMRSSVWL
jgi:hypothetical protein